LELSLPLDAGKRKTSFVLDSKENPQTLSLSIAVMNTTFMREITTRLQSK
jgi:hypothetical protein